MSPRPRVAAPAPAFREALEIPNWTSADPRQLPLVDMRAGDCLDIFGVEPDASFDAIVSDLPAAIGFMGRKWDGDRGGRAAWVAFWAERLELARRKSKPGGFSLTWALPKTQHWTGCAVEDGGWEIIDTIHHVFGQGWNKSGNLLKPAHEVWILARNGMGGELQIDASRVRRDWSDRGAAWLRSGHSAKPEAQKITGAPPGNGISANPLGSHPANHVMSHCPECEESGKRRVKGDDRLGGTGARAPGFGDVGSAGGTGKPVAAVYGTAEMPFYDCLAGCDCGLSVLAPAGGPAPRCACGMSMWWACPVAEIDAQSGHLQSGSSAGFVGDVQRSNAMGDMRSMIRPETIYADSGGASRFFPCFGYFSKAAGGERHAGCEGFYWRANKRNLFGFDRVDRATWEALPEAERAEGNVHPTVKGLRLMEYLVGLVTPARGRVGDLTVGSGGTRLAIERLNQARGLGLTFLGADVCPEAIEIAHARLAYWKAVRHDTKPTRTARVAKDTPAPPQLSLLRPL